MLLLFFLLQLFLGRLPDGDDLAISDGSRHRNGRHLIIEMSFQILCGFRGGHKELVAVRSGDLEAVPDHQLTAGGRNFFDKVFEHLVILDEQELKKFHQAPGKDAKLDCLFHVLHKLKGGRVVTHPFPSFFRILPFTGIFGLRFSGEIFFIVDFTEPRFDLA